MSAKEEALATRVVVVKGTGGERQSRQLLTAILISQSEAPSSAFESRGTYRRERTPASFAGDGLLVCVRLGHLEPSTLKSQVGLPSSPATTVRQCVPHAGVSRTPPTAMASVGGAVVSAALKIKRKKGKGQLVLLCAPLVHHIQEVRPHLVRFSGHRSCLSNDNEFHATPATVS